MNLKDLSFENPNAASGLMAQGKQPKIDIDVNVNNRDLGDRRFEVELHTSVKATVDGQTGFIVECVYAGLVQIGNDGFSFLTGDRYAQLAAVGLVNQETYTFL